MPHLQIFRRIFVENTSVVDNLSSTNSYMANSKLFSIGDAFALNSSNSR